MGKKTFVTEDKDKRLKAQRETILELRREVKELEKALKALEKKLNPAPVYEKVEQTPKKQKKIEPPKKESLEEEREKVRQKWAAWNAERKKKEE